jgi:hypothetical protein
MFIDVEPEGSRRKEVYEQKTDRLKEQEPSKDKEPKKSVRCG